jgi:hypothetical protein
LCTSALELALRSNPCEELMDFTLVALKQAAGNSDLAAAVHSERLFSLLMTACKAAECLVGTEDGSSSASRLQEAVACYNRLDAIACLGKVLAGQCAAAVAAVATAPGASVAGLSSNLGPSSLPCQPAVEDDSGAAAGVMVGSSSDDASKAGELWSVLAARCTFSVCKELELAAAAAAAEVPAGTPQPTSSAVAPPQQLLSSLAAASSWLGEMLQDLEQQQGAAVPTGGSKVSTALGKAAGGLGAAAADDDDKMAAEHKAAEWPTEADGSVTISVTTKTPRRPASAPAGRASKAGLSCHSVTQLVMQHAALQKALNAAVATAGSAASAHGNVPHSGSEVQQAMQLLGKRLLGKIQGFAEQVYAVLPVLKCCRSPACVSLDKRSEVQLVGGSRGRCSGCKACCFCSKECQAAAWRLHKPVCKRLQGSSEAAAVIT